VAAVRIRRRLLAVLLALTACATVPAALLLEDRVGDDARARLGDGLLREALALAAELERAPPTDVPAWIAHLEAPGAARVTVIDSDGTVRGDSEVPVEELARLENHGTRPEVRQALAGRPGTQVRRSATVGRELLYVAVPVGAPPRMVLRLALPLDRVARSVAVAQAAVWLAGGLALAMALALGWWVARRLTGPLSAMTLAARAMARGDFDARLPSPTEDELGELVRALETLRGQMAARIDQLRSEGAKLRTVLNNMSEGVALVQDGTIAVANPAFSALLGAVRPVEGLTPLEAVRLPELAEIVTTATVARAGAARGVEAGGRSLVLEAHPLGEPPSEQAVVVVIDMTEQKRLERLRRDFVANASHELRTPVAAILGAVETLAAGAADDPEARQSFLEILARHSQRLSRLTADLLDIARLEAGYRPRIEAVAVAAAVEAVVTTLRPRAEAKRIVLGTRIGGATVAAERAAVEQILLNLVENAIKYTPEGGRVDITAVTRGGMVELTVGDTGPGIAAEHLPRLFERFYRVDNARSRELGGTGLGLSIVKHLSLANGGDVRVESRVGGGSRFIVSLPRQGRGDA
jgi:two-component system phosphate regulon sensor histidine kinase PhoR